MYSVFFKVAYNEIVGCVKPGRKVLNIFLCFALFSWPVRLYNSFISKPPEIIGVVWDKPNLF